MSKNTYVMALRMVELGNGLSPKQIIELTALLDNHKTYMPIEFHANNTSAYGFILSDYFEEYNYLTEDLDKEVSILIDDWNLLSNDNIYSLTDGEKFYMSF